MTSKDLSAYLAKTLDLKDASGRVWKVPPPTKGAEVQLGAIVAAGAYTWAAVTAEDGAVIEQLPPDVATALESIGGTAVAELALGKGTYDEMIEAGVSGPDIDTLGLYALYYWTVGEDTADMLFEAQMAARTAPAEPAAV